MCSHATPLFIQPLGGALEQHTCGQCRLGWRRVYASEAHALTEAALEQALVRHAVREYGPAIAAWDALSHLPTSVLASKPTTGQGSTGSAGPDPIRGAPVLPFRAVAVWHRALEGQL